MKTNTLTLVLLALLTYLAPTLALEAVAPPPDGCYPNYTTAEGCNALQFLTTGNGNTGLGWYSLFSNTTGSFSTGVGAGALVLNNADSNTAVGAAALLLNNTGDGNTAVGTDAMVYNDIGDDNTAVGAFALFNNMDGFNNDALGVEALFNHQTGSFNNAVDGFALHSDQNGASNNAFGNLALSHNVSGSNNTAVGDQVLLNSTGDYNTALGAGAGNTPGIGSNNIYVGDAGSNGDNNVIAIGALPASQTPYESTFIGGIFGQTVDSMTGTAVYIDASGKLGTMVSSKRFKDDIKPMGKTSEAILALQPVTFCYKKNIDPAGRSQFGLVAEDVEKVNPDLVVRDKEGNPYSVRYDQVNAMLLNEFLKEHRKVEEQDCRLQEQGAMIARQQKQIDVLTAGLQKVSAQLELTKAAPQTVLNNQ